MKWFRAYHSILDSVKVRGMRTHAQLIYIYLLCAASEHRERTNLNTGETGLTIANAAWRLREPHTNRSWREIENAGLAHLDDQGLIIVNDWENRQMQSDDAAIRKRMSRSASRDKVVTCPVLDTDTDTDTDTEKNKGKVKNKAREAAPAVPDWIPHQAWLDWRKHRGSKLTKGAIERQVKTLAELHFAGFNLTDCINRAIECGWATFYPPKPNGNGSTHPNQPQHAKRSATAKAMYAKRDQPDDDSIDGSAERID